MNMNIHQKSIFAASQRAARMVEQDRPVLDFAKTDDERVRDYLKGIKYTDMEINQAIKGFGLITEVRKKLGIKD